MKAVILAGGKGTRLIPYTRILPKSLVPIGDRPIMEILIKQLQHAGVDEMVLAVGHLDKLIRSYFQDGSDWNVKISYSLEKEPLGTVGPLAMIKNLDSTFIVTNSDVLTTVPLSELIRFHKETGAIATIAMHKREVKISLGVIKHDLDFHVVDYVEKPSSAYMASMGIYIFEPRILKYIPSGKYLDFPTLVKILIEAGEKVQGYPFDGYWQDLGNPGEYEQAQLDFAKMKKLFLPDEDNDPISE